MRSTLLCTLLVLASCVAASADTITLDTPETLSPQNSSKLSWEITQINAEKKVMTVRYSWLDGYNETIYLDRPGYKLWTCADIEVFGTNAECEGPSNPFECCTGVGAGTCDDMESTCFTDVFGFTIRAQDVGTKIGAGLRMLIWNKMKQDILSSGNDGEFAQ